MPLLLLVLLFIAVPLVELAVIIEVGEAIGAPATIAILLLDSVLGGVLMRSQGRAAWRRLQDAMRAGRVPHREALDGALVIFGGALLLTPGFITDVVGVLLLVPLTRAVARRLLGALIARRALVGLVGLGRGGPRRGRPTDRFAGGQPRRPTTPPGHRPYDVEGTATDVDEAPGQAAAPRLER